MTRHNIYSYTTHIYDNDSNPVLYPSISPSSLW